MILFQNGRFYRDKVSFLVPDGFYFEEDREINEEHGFCVWSPEKDFLCSWNFYEGCMGSRAELENWLSPECGFTPLSPITPIQINGLPGHFLLYKNQRDQYYEARFDLGKGEELSFLVEVPRGGRDIRQIVDSTTFKMVLNGMEAIARKALT